MKNVPVDWPSMYLGIGIVTSLYLVIGESMQNSLQRVVSNVTLLYFGSIMIGMNVEENMPQFTWMFDGLPDVLGWFIIPEMVSWALARLWNYLSFGDWYIEDSHFDHYWVEDPYSFAVVLRNGAFLMHAYYADWYSFENANWIAALFGAFYNITWSMVNEVDSLEPWKIGGETLDFWFLLLYVVAGGLSYQLMAYMGTDDVEMEA